MPTLMARVTYPKAGMRPQEVPFYFESGWLTFNSIVEGVPDSNSYPLRIYVTDKLRSYYSSSPPTVYGTDDEFWLPIVPEITAGGWYASENWDGDNVNPPIPSGAALGDIPMLYTGLARLWAQGTLALGKKPSDTLSTVFPFNVVFERYKRLGVVRSSDYKYWMVIITAVGAWIWKMQVPTSLTRLYSHLITGPFTGDSDRYVTEAYLLGAMEFPDDPIQVRSESEMEQVYLDGTHHRWDFCDQRLGSSGQNSAKAITTIEKGMFGTIPDKYWTTHIARMQVTFSDLDNPLVSFTTTDEQNWASGTTGLQIFDPYDSITWAWRHEATGGMIGDSNNALGYEVPIRAWHTPDGNEFIVKTGSVNTETVVISEEPSWIDLSNFCGAGEKNGTHHAYTATTYGLIVPDEPNAKIVISGKVFTHNSYTLAAGTSVDWMPYYDLVEDWGPPYSSWFELTFGDASCTSAYLRFDTAEEANATYPGVRVPVGAGTKIEHVEDTWQESGAVRFFFGYYPRTFGYLHSRQGRNLTPKTQKVERLYDTVPFAASSSEGVIVDSIGGATGLYPRNVSQEVDASYTEVETTLVEATQADPEFYAVWVTEHGQRIEETNAALFSWTTVDDLNPVVSGIWNSFASFGKEEIISNVDSTVTLPSGLAESIFDYGLGAWIGGS
jgi:hypothetical protein